MKSLSMAMRSGLTIVLGLAMLLSEPAPADERPAVPRIIVVVPPIPNSPHEAGLRQGLQELGYVDGKNIVVQWQRRFVGTDEELRSFAAELMHSKVDVIVVVGTPAARAAVAATTTPVVFIAAEPVASGLAASLVHPGGNATGVSTAAGELTGKRLEFLRQLIPQARRIACLINSSNAASVLQFEEAQKAAHTLRLELVKLDAQNEEQLDTALRVLPKNGVDALLVTGDPTFHSNKPKLARAVRQAKLPAIFPYREYHDSGVLMSYGASSKEAARKTASYIDKILKGAKPADLPIEQISKYELIIDLRVARELGIKVPRELLQRADEVIR